MADKIKMQKVEKTVPHYLAEMSGKPKPDFPRIHIPLECLPKEAVDWPMKGKYRIVFEGELVGRDQHERSGGDDEEIIGGIEVEVQLAGGESIGSESSVSRKKERMGDDEPAEEKDY